MNSKVISTSAIRNDGSVDISRPNRAVLRFFMRKVPSGSVTAVATILMSSFLFNLILKPPSANGVAAAAAGGQPLIPYNIDWIFPKLRRPSRLWHLASTGVIGFVGFVSKIVIGKCVAKANPCIFR